MQMRLGCILGLCLGGFGGYINRDCDGDKNKQSNWQEHSEEYVADLVSKYYHVSSGDNCDC
jgi:hypothetical protein